MYLFGFQRITADQLAEISALMRGRMLRGAHFIKHHTASGLGGLKCRFASGQSGPDYQHSRHVFIVEVPVEPPDGRLC
jgi:hypothetical protein